MPKEKSAGAIIFYRNPDNKIEYLLLQHTAENWGFPKGLIEKGEKLEETALRECREETGLEKLELMPGFKETIRYFFKVKYDYQVKERGFKMGESVLKFVTYFLVESKTNDVKISFEHKGFKWLPYEEALKQLTFKNAKEILEKADEFLNSKRSKFLASESKTQKFPVIEL